MARNQKQQREASEFEERVVYINRVSKTVKGGRRMSLVALVVVGDGKGNVGVGMGKSAEVPLAISKASLDAKKSIKNVLSKALGTDNGLTIIKAAVEGLKELSSPEDVAARRGLTVSEMFVGKEN